MLRSFMLHGPCGSYNLDAPCMAAKAAGESRTCSKRFPKPFNPVTVIREDGYPEYIRWDDGWKLLVKVCCQEVELDNS